MKTSNPYGANYRVKVPPETIQKEQSQASGKARRATRTRRWARPRRTARRAR